MKQWLLNLVFVIICHVHHAPAKSVSISISFMDCYKKLVLSVSNLASSDNDVIETLAASSSWEMQNHLVSQSAVPATYLPPTTIFWKLNLKTTQAYFKGKK